MARWLAVDRVRPCPSGFVKEGVLTVVEVKGKFGDVRREKNYKRRVKAPAYLSRVAMCLCDGGATVDRELLYLPPSHDFRASEQEILQLFQTWLFPVSTRGCSIKKASTIGRWSESNQTTLYAHSYTFVPIRKHTVRYISCYRADIRMRLPHDRQPVRSPFGK